MAGNGALKLFLCGDVMTGRGIDQVLPHPGDPTLYEPYMTSARGYVELAERANGPIPKPVPFDYIWGDALPVLERTRPDLRLINLETAVTAHDAPWPGKGIHYRMHPANTPCLTAAGLDACVLANNHVLDWGRPGLDETLGVLGQAGLATAGAGADGEAAAAPAAFPLPGGGRLLVFAFGVGDSGIPEEWAATGDRSGVNLLPDLSGRTVAAVAETIARWRREDDRVLASIHWGGNWGYAIPEAHRRFAHGLVREAAVDLVHGHSSHHVKGIEVVDGRLILYGCGDFLNDYEGIGGHERFRDDLTFMYLPTLGPDGRLHSLHLVPMQIRRFRLEHADPADAAWLKGVIDREGRPFGTSLRPREDGSFELRWE